jgi:uncharacterized membrane protein
VNNRHWARWLRRRFREAVRDNQWLMPAIGAITGFLLAHIVGTGTGTEDDPWTVTVDRSRDTLIAALGLVFTALSIVLALASVAAQNVVGRFGSRVLRIYARRSPDRYVIAVFAMAAIFILTEQFQLRRLDPTDPAPIAGLTISVFLLVISGSMVIWYIATLSRWFRVDEVVEAIIEFERHVLRRVARDRREGSVQAMMPERPDNSTSLRAPKSGHLAEVDTDKLLEACNELDAIVVIDRKLGDPVVENEPIGWLAGKGSLTETLPVSRVARMIDVSRTRELGQYIEYGIVAMVDVAIMALSPAINDPNSALEVIEEMSFLFPEIAQVPLGPYAVPDNESWPRVVVMSRTFGEYVELATTQIVLYGITDPNVVMALRRFATSLELLELNDSDRRYVNEFADKLRAAPAV